VSNALRYSQWPQALIQARQGNLTLARAGQLQDHGNPIAAGLFARCLTEANAELETAVALLKEVSAQDPGNPLFPQIMALALARRNGPGDCQDALSLWREYLLPHDLDLLGQTALTLEAQWRPLSPSADFSLSWPENLEFPDYARALNNSNSPSESILSERKIISEAAGSDVFTPGEAQRDKLAPPAATKPSKSLRRKREMASISKQLDQWLTQHKPFLVLQKIEDLLAKNRESADLHLLAGMAAEEAGLWDRARAHLVRCLRLEPLQLHARVMLGRIFLRLNWTDLALALWRSLPVEGPYDHARHYHLALAHGSRCDQASAQTAMNYALRNFFYDTRHGFIQRAWELWELSALAQK
jgi:hypothetical protein